jgi:hypothetical protein
VNARWAGPLFAVVGVFGFSAKAVLVKLATRAPSDAVTLLALRMIYSAPFFIAMAWWTSRPPAQRLSPTQWRRLALLGFIGYYLSSLLDFMGLAYITASLERLIFYLYPTFVVLLSRCCSASRSRGAPCSRSPCRTADRPGVRQRLRVSGRPGALYWRIAGVRLLDPLRALSCARRRHHRPDRQHALRLLGDARLHRVRAGSSRPPRPFLLAVPRGPPARPGDGGVLDGRPTWLIAEAIRRIGANASLIGCSSRCSIGLGASILGEPVHAIQLAGAALVLAGVTLVTLRVRAEGSAAAARGRDGIAPES